MDESICWKIFLPGREKERLEGREVAGVESVGPT
jgi:hypothetical protein